MPGFPPDTRARIAKWLPLQSVGRKTDTATVGKKALPVHRDQVRHGPALVQVTMEPETALHREDHSVAATLELSIRYDRLALCV